MDNVNWLALENLKHLLVCGLGMWETWLSVAHPGAHQNSTFFSGRGGGGGGPVSTSFFSQFRRLGFPLIVMIHDARAVGTQIECSVHPAIVSCDFGER